MSKNKKYNEMGKKKKKANLMASLIKNINSNCMTAKTATDYFHFEYYFWLPNDLR